MQQPQLTIVVPAYNEAPRVEKSLRDLASFFGGFGQGVEILLVVEKSTDGTVDLAKGIVGHNPQFRIIANEVHKGKGFAVKTGMLQARGDIVFFMDLDLSTPLVEVLKFLSHFQTHPGVDVVIGSRQHPESQVIKRQHLLRQTMGKTFNFFVRVFAFEGITDTQCGFKAFRARCVKPIFTNLATDGAVFLNEINTLPGFTSISMYPKLWEKSGVTYDALITQLLDLAVAEWQTKQQLQYQFAPAPAPTQTTSPAV
jgi:dolichyl-phosphate beta-glucosyltransferase